MREWLPLSIVALTLPMLACVDWTLAGDDGSETQTDLETSSTDSETSTGDSESGTSDSETGTDTTETETETETGPLAECGDGIVDLDESCDDGNSIDDDVCSNSCTYNLDPLCTDDSLPTLFAEDRFPNVDGPGGVQLCDQAGAMNQSPDWVGPGWYHFGEFGGAIPLLGPPEDYACGGTSGGWVDSPYPTVEDGHVNVTICFAFGPDSCARSVEAVMINCWDQPNMLRLPDVPGCDLRYCMEQLRSP